MRVVLSGGLSSLQWGLSPPQGGLSCVCVCHAPPPPRCPPPTCLAQAALLLLSAAQLLVGLAQSVPLLQQPLRGTGRGSVGTGEGTRGRRGGTRGTDGRTPTSFSWFSASNFSCRLRNSPCHFSARSAASACCPLSSSTWAGPPLTTPTHPIAPPPFPRNSPAHPTFTPLLRQCWPRPSRWLHPPPLPHGPALWGRSYMAWPRPCSKATPPGPAPLGPEPRCPAPGP